MRLYFVRHGHAEDGINIADHDRQLTAQGIARMQTAARVMKRLEIAPTNIYSSPRVRARQTAEIIADVLGKTIDIRPEVDFSFNVQAVATLIADHTADDEVMFVGHNPSMSDVVGELTGARVSMKKGGLARVDVPATALIYTELVWYIAPKVFDALDA